MTQGRRSGLSARGGGLLEASPLLRARCPAPGLCCLVLGRGQPGARRETWALRVSDREHQCSWGLQPKPHRLQSASYRDELSEASVTRTEGCSSRVTVGTIPAVQRHLASLCSFALT